MINFLANSSRDTPLVSGIIKCVKINCKTIIKAKNANTNPGPIKPNRNGTNDGMIAAKTQCVEIPNDWP